MKRFWKRTLTSNKNRWETNLSKVIQKTLVLDLSISINKNRSRHQRCFVKRGVLKNWALQLYWNRISDTGVFLWILRNFKNTFFIEHLRETASRKRKPYCARNQLHRVVQNSYWSSNVIQHGRGVKEAIIYT